MGFHLFIVYLVVLVFQRFEEIQLSTEVREFESKYLEVQANFESGKTVNLNTTKEVIDKIMSQDPIAMSYFKALQDHFLSKPCKLATLLKAVTTEDPVVVSESKVELERLG